MHTQSNPTNTHTHTHRHRHRILLKRESDRRKKRGGGQYGRKEKRGWREGRVVVVFIDNK